MDSKVGVELGVVARIAVDVAATFRRDGAELDAEGVASVVEVLERMTVATEATELLATAVDKATSQAEPEVGREVALGALLGDCCQLTENSIAYPLPGR